MKLILNEGLSYNELADLERKFYPYIEKIWAHEVHFENMKHLDGDDINLLLYADVGGDWKHDHLAYRDAVKEFCEDNGFEIVSHREKEIGDSQSDDYESEHIFWIHKKKLAEKVRKKLYRESVEDILNGKHYVVYKVGNNSYELHPDFVAGKFIPFTLGVNQHGKFDLSFQDRDGWHEVDSDMKSYGDVKNVLDKIYYYYKKRVLHESINYYDGETRLSPVEKKFLNSICFRYCGWKEPKEIRGLWEELLEHGIDVGIISGYPDSVAPDGGKSWTVTFSKDDKLVINSKFVYQVYEPADGSKNEYNMYFS